MFQRRITCPWEHPLIHTQTEHEPRKTTGLPCRGIPISEITGNISGPTQDTKAQGGLDMKWLWSFSSLGRKWSQERDAQESAHLKMNLSYCLGHEIKCSFKSFRVFVSTPTRYHSGRGKMAKHPKTGITPVQPPTLLYTQAQRFAYLPIKCRKWEWWNTLLWTKRNQIPPVGEQERCHKGGEGACVPLGSCTRCLTPDPTLFWFCFACELVTGTFCGFLVKNTLGCSQIERVEGHKEGYDAAEVYRPLKTGFYTVQSWMLMITNLSH